LERRDCQKPCLSSENAFDNCIATHIEMRRNVAKDTRERSNLDWIVIGNRNVVLAAFAGGQTQVAASLTCNLVAKFF
jgi:hypothetical protein